MKAIKLVLLALFSLVLISTIVFAPGAVNITPSEPTDNDNLVCSISGESSDNLIYYQYKWYVNGERDTNVGNVQIYPASRTSVNDHIVCSVFTPSNFFLGLDSVTVLTEEEVNHAPNVFIFLPRDGDVFSASTSINFIAVGTDQDHDSLTFSWDFGDGTRGSGYNTMHTYNEPGIYTVTVTVSDGKATDSDSIEITITELKNQLPVAVINVVDRIVNPSDKVFLDCLDSYDPDGTIVSCQWNFGDKTGAIGSSVVHTYSNPGVYRVWLTVGDNDGAKDDASIIVVVNTLPIANAGPDRTDVCAEAGEKILFNSGKSRDIDGEIESYEWNFGDGTEANGGLVTHSYSTGGTYTVTLTVIDNDEGVTSDTALVCVLGVNPVAVIEVESTNAFLGFPLTFDGSNSYDPDGTIVSYEWNFGDGSRATGAIVEHTFINQGIYTVTLTAIDNDGLRGTASITINAGNVNRGSDFDRQRINPSVMDRDFSISRVMPLENKEYYNRGENIIFLVKLTNEGSVNEEASLRLRLLELNFVSNINNIHLEPSQVKWFMITMPIPSDTNPGLYVAMFNLIPRDSNDLNDIAYWQFNIA